MEIKAYSGGYFSDYANGIAKKAKTKITSLADKYLLSVDEGELVNSVFSEFKIQCPSIDLNSPEMEKTYRNIPIRDFPHAFGPGFRDDFESPNRTEKKVVLTIEYPSEGNLELLILKTNPYSMTSYELEWNRKSASFEVICYDDNKPEEYRRAIENRKQNILKHLEYLDSDINKFNSSLYSQIKSHVSDEKKRVQQRNSLIEQIGIPLKKRDNIPATFTIPAPVEKKRVNVEYPKIANSTPLDPALDDRIYQDILSLLNDVGKAFEKYPSTYEKKKEEDIRDILLLFLETHFTTMSATAESFNKDGKTDIMLKYQSNNVFVAECKIWGGKKRLLEKDITQLLNYLTWRDSKAALLIFVKEKSISTILTNIQETIKKHPHFKKELGAKDASWFNYRLTLPEATDKEVSVAVIVFHLPE